jgi:pyridinium-3,5-biscarboxylic acid mononucleotide sulfurtransferase
VEPRKEKLLKLDSILKDLNSMVVAFSGGVDSTFLLHRANLIRKSGVIAVTIRTPYIPARDIDETIEFSTSFDIKHKVIDIAFPELISGNPIDRCYLCKKTIFTYLLSFAKENNYRYVIDGTNADDTGDFSHGIAALKELGIRSPLLEANLTKKDIRELSREAELDSWYKPAIACLLTRIPCDTGISEGTLRLIEEAENMLLELGYPGTRIRLHGDLARIECMPGYINKIVRSPDKEHIISNLKRIGFRYVSLDLEGYRTGSSNPEKRVI